MCPSTIWVVERNGKEKGVGKKDRVIWVNAAKMSATWRHLATCCEGELYIKPRVLRKTEHFWLTQRIRGIHGWGGIRYCPGAEIWEGKIHCLSKGIIILPISSACLRVTLFPRGGSTFLKGYLLAQVLILFNWNVASPERCVLNHILSYDSVWHASHLIDISYC